LNKIKVNNKLGESLRELS